MDVVKKSLHGKSQSKAKLSNTKPKKASKDVSNDSIQTSQSLGLGSESSDAGSSGEHLSMAGIKDLIASSITTFANDFRSEIAGSMNVAFREMHALLNSKLSATNPISDNPSQAPAPTLPAEQAASPPLHEPRRQKLPVGSLRGPELGSKKSPHSLESSPSVVQSYLVGALSLTGPGLLVNALCRA